MAVKRKAEKETVNPQAIDEVINRGGQVSRDNWDKKDKTQDEEVRFTLRIPKNMINKIDEKRKQIAGHKSRNQLILDILNLNLD